jgi:uncharacterized protein YneF (UPF0154 family)
LQYNEALNSLVFILVPLLLVVVFILVGVFVARKRKKKVAQRIETQENDYVISMY